MIFIDKISFRSATLNDIPFIAETIIEAEKSGTDLLTYTTIFGLSEQETINCLSVILSEKTDGCELSLSSFLIAELNEQNAAAISAWTEGEKGIPSTVIKGNLLSHFLPEEALRKALSMASILSDTHIGSIQDSIQIGLVYVAKEFRGMDLVSLLIDKQIEFLSGNLIRPSAAYVQVYGNNLPAIKAYEKANFKKVLVRRSDDNTILKIMPSDTKILMKRDL